MKNHSASDSENPSHFRLIEPDPLSKLKPLYEAQ